MQPVKILIVDDESRMRRLIRDYLLIEKYNILEAGDGEEAIDVFYKNKDIDLIILDVMMPKMNGFEVLKEIRQTSDVPVIMLTAKSMENDELEGFEAGADEYIVKPFSPKILVARVKAVLKRTSTEEESTSQKNAGILTINESARTVSIQGENVTLSAREFDLLLYFMKNQGIVLSRERILEQVWEYDYIGDDRTVDTHVKKLRSKMGIAGDYIKTVWGIGYKFEVNE